MGTHNCLMQLGEAMFLEIIATDPAASPQRRRWFALDDPLM
jgi:TusA-related sulfurtransferase